MGFILVLTTSLSYAQQFSKSFSVQVTNPEKSPRESVLVFVAAENIKSLHPDFNIENFVVIDKGKEIPCQYTINDVDYKGLLIVIDKLNASEKRTLIVKFNPEGKTFRNYEKRTQAELSHKIGGKFVNREYIGGKFVNVNYLRVPPEHKDHSWFIRYEGPGWESDKVGYRFYLDQRNATDMFGKKTSKMVLHQVGLDGFDSYHNMQPWGMDVMKVGKSLGLGSIGMLSGDTVVRVEKTDSVTCSITENGNIFSSIETNYYGWKVGGKKYNLQSRISIHAGTHLTHQLLTIEGTPDRLCTGIVKDKQAKVFFSKGDDKHWAYIATFGKQSLNKDELGMVVFFNPKDFIDFTEDKFSHVISLRPTNGKVEYYFAGLWAQDGQQIKDEDRFQQYITKMSGELGNSVVVELKK